ncbi:MAG: cation diffusion facilitator family transporter [Bryobacteraceae bacterium]
MNLSLAAAVVMLVGKISAWLYTGSAAILADAAESVVHLLAVGFAAFSFRLSHRPADPRFLYGYERISFFSAGFEGAMIILAAIFIIVSAVEKWRGGLELNHLGLGTAVVATAGALNALLGWHLVRTGRRNSSLILIANGKHVLTDSWTSLGVVGGLLLVTWTGWKPFDPIFAIAVALQILFSGGRLVWRSVTGLMDRGDPELARTIAAHCDRLCAELGLEYHELRFRDTGVRLLIEVHLLFPAALPLGEAHRIATIFEQRLPCELRVPADVTTHLESLEDHSRVHAEIQESISGSPIR